MKKLLLALLLFSFCLVAHAGSAFQKGQVNVPISGANGGLGTDVSGSTGIVKLTSGTPSFLTAPAGSLVGTTATQPLTNKDLTGAGNSFPTFNQNTSGNAATVTISDAGSDTTTWCLFTITQTGNFAPRSDDTCTYNSSTGALSITSLLVGNTGLTVGASVPFSDSGGTLTLQNVDALDSTTETTIEAALDTLANVTSIQGNTFTLTGAFIRSGAHSFTQTTTGTTNVTYPLSGTLATLAGTEQFNNKTFGMGSANTAASPVGRLTTVLANVGNVGGGTDDLQTYAMPANTLTTTGQCIRITAWGTTANNSVTKTVTMNFGATTMITTALTVSIAGSWRIVGEVCRTGSSAQDYNAALVQGATVLVDAESGTATITESGSITIKCTGAATSNNDIVQSGMTVESY